jgi:hypothetical protein
MTCQTCGYQWDAKPLDVIQRDNCEQAQVHHVHLPLRGDVRGREDILAEQLQDANEDKVLLSTQLAGARTKIAELNQRCGHREERTNERTRADTCLRYISTRELLDEIGVRVERVAT